MTKMTYVDALNTALEIIGNDGRYTDAKEKLEALRDSIAKRNSERKPTATQKQNVEFKALIANLFAANPGKGYRVSEVIAAVPEFAGFSTPKVTALLNQMCAEGNAVRETEKRVTVFHA